MDPMLSSPVRLVAFGERSPRRTHVKVHRCSFSTGTLVGSIGAVAVLVNRAGILTEVPLVEMDVATWDEMIAGVSCRSSPRESSSSAPATSTQERCGPTEMPVSSVCSFFSTGVAASVGDAGDMAQPSHALVSTDKVGVVPGAPPAVHLP